MPELILPIRSRGALVRILVRPGSTQHQHLLKDERATWQAGPFAAYLDTGASHTMIDGNVIETLALRSIAEATVAVLGREDAAVHEIHDVEIALFVPNQPLQWMPLIASQGSVFATGASIALGRDFLSHLVMIYDGPRKQVTLRW